MTQQQHEVLHPNHNYASPYLQAIGSHPDMGGKVEARD